MADVMKKQPKMKKKESLAGKIIEYIILILLFCNCGGNMLGGNGCGNNCGCDNNCGCC